MVAAVTTQVASAQLVDADINDLSDRRAMGLPENYLSPVLERFAEFPSGIGSDELLQRLADPGASPDRRVAAGTMLALLGDPRLSSGPQLVDVPAGAAAIGTDSADIDALYAESAEHGVRRPWIVKECPRHQVEVAAFRIARHPVTNSEYAAFLLDSGEPELPSSWHYGRFHPALANHPVYTVSPGAADRYAAWLAASTGRRFRLPTEAEWEYAAGGPDGSRYPWGSTWSADRANTLEAGILGTTPVGAFPAGASWCGALDLAGNVEEFVSDRYEPYPGGELVEDDLYLRMGRYRIARGGAFNRFRDLARNQRRHGPYPRSLYAMGFRVAEGLPEPDRVPV